MLIVKRNHDMKNADQAYVLADFFLDGAKIIFGSLVVGAFIPNLGMKEFPLLSFFMGIYLTSVFLFVAHIASRNDSL